MFRENNTLAATPDTGVLKRLVSRKGAKLNPVETLAIGVMVAQAAYSGINKWRERRAQMRTVTLKFREDTPEYQWLCKWLAKQPRLSDESRGRTFSAKHLDSCDGRLSAPTAFSDEPPDASARRTAWALIPDNIQGFKFEDITLGISKDDAPKQDDMRSFLARTVTLTCVTRDMVAVERLLASIHDAGHEESKIPHVPRVMALTTWGDWSEVRKAPANRTPVLPKGILESLMADVKWFAENEGWYHSVGVPYRRGYLFHGIPGSGKTTTAISLASKFNRDIYVLPLEGLSDEKLMQAVRHAGRDGVLVIEDIDCASVSNERETQTQAKSKDTPTLMGLLNAIDGVATPEGRILIATTNRREVLDKALIRPGRFDREFSFSHADYHQILELCRRFGLNGESEPTAEQWHSESLSMATVQQRLIEKCGLGER
jgi:hypothetical protein